MTYLQFLSCCLLLFLLLPLRNINADQPPSPGYYPTTYISKIDFHKGFKCQWGCEHQNLSQDGVQLTMWLDSSSGSGFKSKSKYKVSYGYIGADIKLDPGPYTAGLDTSFYLSSSDSCAGEHDEVDIEFLGHTKGNPYVLSTNVYVYGHFQDGIDRGMRFNLPFDPSEDYHNYAIYWDQTQIININALDFDEGFECQWGCQHQNLSQDGVLTMWLNSSSGSGFNSQSKYKVSDGNYIGADIKLDPGPYTAGLDTSFYLSSSDSCAGEHDEVDIEFLGHTKGNPYVLSTNVYVYGHFQDGIDRGMRFNLSFDPSEDYHNYAIYWDQTQIIFFVDDIPIRNYPEKSSFQVPQGSMKVYGSIWDASAWATDNGNSKISYQQQESFYAYYKNFRIQGCDLGDQYCSPVPVFPYGSTELSEDQKSAMKWVQKRWIIQN